MSETVQRTEWPHAAQLTVLAATVVSAVMFVTGFVFTLPASAGLLVVGLLAKRELGRYRLAVILLAALGILLALAWLFLTIDWSGGGGAPDSGPLEGTVVE